jgi:hypothetical protein
MLTADDFTVHVARVRDRFASTLNSKIADSFEALERMSAGGANAVEITIVTHRRLHEMYGVAPTLGFVATGKAAGAARAALRDAAKAKRAATPTELALLKTELEHLRDAAAADLRNLLSGEKSDAS